MKNLSVYTENMITLALQPLLLSFNKEKVLREMYVPVMSVIIKGPC